MRSHAPFEPIVTKFFMWGRVNDVITGAKFYENRLRGFGVTRSPQTPFPILNVHHPYNSVSTTVLHCDTDMVYLPADSHTTSTTHKSIKFNIIFTAHLQCL